MKILDWLFGGDPKPVEPEWKPNFDASKVISAKPCGNAMLDKEAAKLLERSKGKTRVVPHFDFPVATKG